jgi:hypothetical protein
MMTASYLWSFFTSFSTSVLLVLLFYSLTIQVFKDEHSFFLTNNGTYEECSPWQRLLFIFWHARILTRIILIIALVGLYYGALSLGRDLQVGWEIYSRALSQ